MDGSMDGRSMDGRYMTESDVVDRHLTSRPTRPFGERFAGRHLVARTEHDHMAALQPVLPVKCSVP